MEAAANSKRAPHQQALAAITVAGGTAQQQKRAERQQVGVDHPLQVGSARLKRLLWPIAGKATLMTEPSDKGEA